MSEINNISINNNKLKVMLIIPGVTGSSNSPYIKDICGEANKKGYIVAILNFLCTDDGDED